jgi:hypothetical protein
VTWQDSPATCPSNSPGFVADGSFSVTITDSPTCTGTYDLVVQLTGAQISYPVIPAQSITGVTAGTYTFNNAGAGAYTVLITETSVCNPINDPETIIVTVGEGVDNEEPVFYVTDILGNIIADNDPATAVNDDVVLADYDLPEGSCSYQEQWFVFGNDNCDGAITVANAVTASSITDPSTIIPGTQTIVTNGNLGFYTIDVDWSTGETDITVCMSDASGNTPCVDISRSVQDENNPEVIIAGANNTTIPQCDSERTIIVTVYVSDLCDQEIDEASIVFNTPGSPQVINFTGDGYVEYAVTIDLADNGNIWIASYTDAGGNEGFADVQINVDQAVEDMPALIIAADDNVTIPYCEDELTYCYSFQIWDDCSPVDPNLVSFNGGGSGLSITYEDINSQTNVGFFEACGTVTANTYSLNIEYDGQIIEPLVVINQQANQSPEIIFPGNLNFILPVCQVELVATVAVQFSDDCDDIINPDNVEVILEGVELDVADAYISGGYFEWTITLTADNDGDYLSAAYTDSDGITTLLDPILTVTEQPDNWSPIIVYPSQAIFIELDACDAPAALVSFDVTATDNCDGDLIPDVDINGDYAIVNTPGGDSYIAVLGVGEHTIMITATDAAGNTTVEDFMVFITQPDAVEDNLACLATVNATLGDNCEAVLDATSVLIGEWGCLTEEDFTVTVIDSDSTNGGIIDGCGTFGYNISINAPPATQGFTGDFAPSNWTVMQNAGDQSSVGFTASTMTLTTLATGPFDGNDFQFNEIDAMAVIAVPSDGTVSFDYDFNGYDAGWDWFVIDIEGNVVAQSAFQTTGSVAEFTVNAGDALLFGIDDDGLNPGGPDLPSVLVVDGFNFTPAGAPANFTQCWGEVVSEDKTNPTVDCPADIDEVTYDRDVQFVTGALEETDASMNTSDYSCMLGFFNPVDGIHYYDTYSFTVNTTDIYTFEINSVWGDASAALYQGAFDVDDPCQNIIAQSEDQTFYPGGFFVNLLSTDPVIRISIPLIAGQTYTLFTTSWDTEITGDYTWSVYSDGNGKMNGVAVQTEAFTYDLICDDIDQVLLNGVHYYTANADGSTVSESISAALKNVLDLTGYPEVWDNCGQIRVSVWDSVEEFGDCGDVIITRHFDIADRYNSDCTGAPMTVSCSQEITLRKVTSADLSLPPFTVPLECDEAFATDDNGNPDPSVTGFPFVQTAFGIHDLNQVYCSVAASYEDGERIEICESAYKFIRTWTLIDWCNPAGPLFHQQVINVGDFTAPEITCNQNDTDWDDVEGLPTWSTGPFDCTAVVNVFDIPGGGSNDAITVTDNCSSYEISVDVLIHEEENIYNQWGQIVGTQVVESFFATVGPGQSPFVAGVPISTLGNHIFRYTVVDDCGNTTIADCEFAVADQIAPVAICDDQLTVSIGGDGFARVYAVDINEGSNDNCSEVTIEVRRDGGPWGDYVDFDCEDVSNYVTIGLRVWDEAGNSNMCWLEILIEDKINPYCHAPYNETRHCDDEVLLHIDWDDVDQLNEVFGEAWAEDNCNVIVEQVSINNNLNDCGWGTVVRTFRAIDDWGNVSTNQCQQVITVYEVHNYEIKFPKDASAECGIPNPDTISYNTLGCDLITVNVSDETYEATSDECYKILRTYKVINWCEWDGESDPIVIGRDEDCDNNPGDEDVWVIVRTEWNGNDPLFTAYVDRNNNEADTNPFIGTSRCTPLPKPNGHWANSGINVELTSVGHWQYTQVIKVYDFVEPTAEVDDYDTFCSETSDCLGDVAITFKVEELCDLDVVSIEGFIDAFADGILEGNATVVEVSRDEATNTITYEISGNYPLGSHSFGVHIEDGCNNITWLEIPFDVVDCKAPTPVCIDGLTVTLMPQLDGCCAMAIWASDFIASDIEDCSEPIQYSIHRSYYIVNGTEIPNPETTGLVLDCNDEDITLIRIYSWDSAYNPYAVQPDGTVGGPNYDYCETYVLVQENVSCIEPATSTIAGLIQTEETIGIEGTEVQLSGNSLGTDHTTDIGSYQFLVIDNGYDYTITPHLDENPLNGVTTFDLVLITKHILGVQLLDSPYKMIAADANSSGLITTADMIQIRKLILGIFDDFPNNTSWRFVDADYIFPDPTNPWSAEFPEFRNINNLTADMLAEDFIGAKIGDVNGTVTPNLTVVEERNVNGLLTLITADRKVKPGTDYSVSFTAADLDKLQGYQFTLNFDKSALSLTDIEYGVATEENFGMKFINEGMLTASYNVPNGQTIASDAVLFTLNFNAKANAQLSELITITSRITRAEAYSTADELLDVAMSFTNQAIAARFEVCQNTPNPFDSETKIAYNLPEHAVVTVTIQDVTGKTLKVLNQDGQKGYNSVILDAKALGLTGLLYYTVETDKNSITKKMIVMD